MNISPYNHNEYSDVNDFIDNNLTSKKRGINVNSVLGACDYQRVMGCRIIFGDNQLPAKKWREDQFPPAQTLYHLVCESIQKDDHGTDG